MATSYTRRINLYINGKEVKNDIASIRAEMNRLVNAQSFNDFDERLDNLSALTGLAGEDLTALGETAKKLSTTTLESGVRVTQSATEIVDAFTKVGSARPELLKNKDALVAVTQEAIILSNAAKIKLQPAIEGLTMVMNQYNVSADQARRNIYHHEKISFSNDFDDRVVLLLGLLGFFDLVARLTPTEKDNSIVNFLMTLFNAIIPNLRKGGGSFKLLSK
jgi:hypothetical protein